MKLNKNSVVLYILLFLSIVFVFGIFNLLNNQNIMYIDLFGNKERVNEDILIEENGEYYLSYEYIKEKIDNEIYYDNVSKKVVIASDKCLLKARLNEKKVNNNFNEEETENIVVIEKNTEYISLEVLNKAYSYNFEKYKNVIYIYENKEFECVVNSNNVRIYETSSLKSKVIGYEQKNAKLTGIMEKGDFVLVKTETGKIGYVSSKLISYTVNNETQKEEENTFTKYIFADTSSKYIDKNLDLDGVFVNMFEIIKKSGEVSVKGAESSLLASIKSNGYKAYGIVTNGYNLAGFNTTTLSQILSDESKRLQVINNIVNKAEEYGLDGIVIDFRMIKESDASNFVQFIKEFNAYYEKEVVVNINANEYKNYVSAIKYSDFSVINFYGLRDLSSTVAGSVSEISWQKEITENILKEVSANKIVACIPSYSILWTEKNSKVVDAKIYSLSAIQDYVAKNNLTKKYIENVGQNYIECAKGSLVYKMWVEDEVSTKNRMEIIKGNNLKGVAIYKLGYENNDMYNLINEEI